MIDPKRLEEIVRASSYIHRNTQQRGAFFPSLHYRDVMEVVFGEEQTPIFKLAMKIIEGAEFTAEDLQLQQNEPEALEKMLREIKEFIER